MKELILKPKEVSFEEAAGAKPLPDIKTFMLNNIIDLEKEIKLLKKRIDIAQEEGRIEEEDVDRIKYLQEELQMILSD